MKRRTQQQQLFPLGAVGRATARWIGAGCSQRPAFLFGEKRGAHAAISRKRRWIHRYDPGRTIAQPPFGRCGRSLAVCCCDSRLLITPDGVPSPDRGRQLRLRCPAGHLVDTSVVLPDAGGGGGVVSAAWLGLRRRPRCSWAPPIASGAERACGGGRSGGTRCTPCGRGRAGKGAAGGEQAERRHAGAAHGERAGGTALPTRGAAERACARDGRGRTRGRRCCCCWRTAAASADLRADGQAVHGGEGRQSRRSRARRRESASGTRSRIRRRKRRSQRPRAKKKPGLKSAANISAALLQKYTERREKARLKKQRQRAAKQAAKQAAQEGGQQNASSDSD